MIVTARVGIDEAMIVNPPQFRTGPLATPRILPPTANGWCRWCPGQWHLRHQLPDERLESEPHPMPLEAEPMPPGTF